MADDDKTTITDPYKLNMGEVSMALEGYTKELEIINRQNLETTESIRRLNEASEKFNDHLRRLGISMKEAGDEGEKTTRSFQTALRTVNALGTGILSLSDAGRVATNSLQGLDSLFSTMGPYGQMIGTVVGMMGKMVNAYDQALLAQKAMIDANLQLGMSYATQTAQIEGASQNIRKIGNQWGYLREETAKFVSQMTAQGLGARMADAEGERGPGGIDQSDARRVGAAFRDIPNAIEAAMLAHRAYGLSLDMTTKLATQMGTVFGIQSIHFQESMGNLVQMGNKSSLGLNRYLDTVMQLTEQTKLYGQNLAGIAFFTGEFSDQIKKGTITMDNLVKIISPAAMDPGQLAAIALQIQQQTPQLAQDLGITGMEPMRAVEQMQNRFSDINKRTAKGEDLRPEDDRALDAMRTGIRMFIPGIEKMPGFFSQKILEAFGIIIPNMTAAKEFLTGNLAEAKQVYADAFKNQQAAAQALRDGAEAAFKPYETINQKMQTAGENFRNIITAGGREFVDIITMKSARTGIANLVSDPAGNLADVITHIGSKAMGIDEGDVAAAGQRMQDRAKARRTAVPSEFAGSDATEEPYRGYTHVPASFASGHKGGGVTLPSAGGVMIDIGGINLHLAPGRNQDLSIREQMDGVKNLVVNEVEKARAKDRLLEKYAKYSG